MKKWISFDLDGTLMQNPFTKWIFPEVEATIQSCLGRPYDVKTALVAEHERRFTAGQPVAAYDWDDIVRQLLEQLSLSTVIDMESLIEKHAAPPKSYLLEATIPDVLGKLQERGYSLAAVTNGFWKYQYPVMEALGLSAYFEQIITPEKVGFAKPDVQIFEPLLSSGELVAHVGDRLDHDVQAANRAHTLSVWICRTLPTEAAGIPPRARASHPLITAACKQKWAAETRRTDIHCLPQEVVPQVVIHTLEELPACL